VARLRKVRPERLAGRGSVRLRSADPWAAPEIRLDLVEVSEDRQTARDLLAFIHRFFTTKPVADLVGAELMPGPEVESEAAIDAHLRNTIQTGMHPTSACTMGPDPSSSVTDAQRRVHGDAPHRQRQHQRSQYYDRGKGCRPDPRTNAPGRCTAISGQSTVRITKEYS
jgi:choline dehydrogenase